MKFFVAFVVACVLISLGAEGMKDSQGVPGEDQASWFVIIFDVIAAGWGLYLLLATR